MTVIVAPSGGSADLGLANTSEGIDVETGSGDQDNSEDSLIGLQVTDDGASIGLLLG
ncbi:MAG: hypothetical protein WD646_07880 [Actinomycetota bacterium]